MRRLLAWTKACPVICFETSALQTDQRLFGFSLARLSKRLPMTRSPIVAWTSSAKGPSSAHVAGSISACQANSLISSLRRWNELGWGWLTLYEIPEKRRRREQRNGRVVHFRYSLCNRPRTVFLDAVLSSEDGIR